MLKSHECVYVVWPGIKASSLACAALPVAAVSGILLWFHMRVIHMVHQILQALEQQMALQSKDRRSREEDNEHRMPRMCESFIIFNYYVLNMSSGFRNTQFHWSRCCLHTVDDSSVHYIINNVCFYITYL